MPYVRQRGNQIAIVLGERDSDTGKVQQRILFTIYSKAEALKIIGRKDKSSARYLQDLLAHEYPGIRFDWNKINKAIACFELGRYEDTLTHFLYGTLNYPRTSRILNGRQMPKPIKGLEGMYSLKRLSEMI